MRQAQLASLPQGDGRRSVRRIVNLAAELREPGATLADAVVHDLAAEGFMAETEMPLEAGSQIWLKLPGLEPQSCRVVWTEDGRAGFEFSVPLHPASLELLVTSTRKPPIRRHFGPQS